MILIAYSLDFDSALKIICLLYSKRILMIYSLILRGNELKCLNDHFIRSISCIITISKKIQCWAKLFDSSRAHFLGFFSKIILITWFSQNNPKWKQTKTYGKMNEKRADARNDNVWCSTNRKRASDYPVMVLPQVDRFCSLRWALFKSVNIGSNLCGIYRSHYADLNHISDEFLS